MDDVQIRTYISVYWTNQQRNKPQLSQAYGQFISGYDIYIRVHGCRRMHLAKALSLQLDEW